MTHEETLSQERGRLLKSYAEVIDPHLRRVIKYHRLSADELVYIEQQLKVAKPRRRAHVGEKSVRKNG